MQSPLQWRDPFGNCVVNEILLSPGYASKEISLANNQAFRVNYNIYNGEGHQSKFYRNGFLKGLMLTLHSSDHKIAINWA